MTQLRLVIVLTGAAMLAAALVAASLLTAGKDEPAAAAAPAASGLFAAVPQDGLVLGSADAPVTLVEYADLQCPYCAEWAVRTMPTLVDDYVRTGKLRIVFHGLAFLGPDSDKAVRAVIAASRDDRLWNVVDGLYRSQGAENSGWVTDGLIDEIAAGAGLDGDDLRDLGSQSWVDEELGRANAAAEAAGVQGTPSFELGPTSGELELVQPPSLGPEGLTPLIDDLLK
jgi:protein-disulfide isomerase